MSKYSDLRRSLSSSRAYKAALSIFVIARQMSARTGFSQPSLRDLFCKPTEVESGRVRGVTLA